jgi:hypothetical protein
MQLIVLYIGVLLLTFELYVYELVIHKADTHIEIRKRKLFLIISITNIENQKHIKILNIDLFII